MTQVGVRDATGRFTETFEIFAKLPGPGSLTPINVRHALTVAELKSLIELVCGIPSDLQLLSYRHHAVLTDGDTLGKLCVLPGARLPVKIVYGFDGLVDAALRGDLTEVLRSVSVTKDAGGMARRKFVAMFIAAHKGYHYLVDRMLSEGAHPDNQTPSGRTALHVACAMGNSGCIDSLVQHGASLDVRDASGSTPADTAASCGQQGAQRRLVLYTRILANRAPRERPCSWSTSPRFPKSKLGSSVTPTISLRDLVISSGPEIMITAWDGRDHHHHYLERSRRPRSAKSSLFHSDSSTSSTESWGSSKDGSKSCQPPQTASPPEGLSASHHEKNDKDPMVTRSVHLHERPKSAVSSNAKHTLPKTPSPKSVKFAFDEAPPRSASMTKYSSYYSGSTARRPAGLDQFSTQKSILTSKTASMPEEKFDNERRKSPRQWTRTKVENDESETANQTQRERFSSSTNRKSQEEMHQTAHPAKSATGDTLPDDSSSDSSDDLALVEELKQTNGLGISYLNDKLRAMVGLPVQHPQRLELMKEEEGRQPPRSVSPTKRTRKPTPEENEQAFKDWLASKTQDARDRRLVNRVGKMLDDAFGKRDETLIANEDEDQTPKKIPLKFEAWCDKKSAQEKLHSVKLKGEMEKQDQRKEEQLAARLSNGTTVEKWLAEKVKKQKQERLAERQRESERQQQKAEREKAAQGVFRKWCMQKEWEELQMLKGRRSPDRKRRPRSGNKTKVHSAHASNGRIRSHSAPPRRHPAPTV